jgi:predicted Zn-dependent peptidase
MSKGSLKMRYLTVICGGPSAEDESRYAAAIMGSIIGDSDGSRLYWELIDPGLADEADFSHHGFAGTGTSMGYATCAPQRGAEVEEKFLGVLDGAHENITEDEVKRAAAKIAMDLTVQNERPLGRMMAVGSQWLYLGRYLPVEDQLRRIHAVTPGDIERLLREYPLRPRTVVRLGPGEE